MEKDEDLQSIKLERNFLDLDLDYFESTNVPCSPWSQTSLSPNSPDTPSLTKLVLLGAQGVGKTSIIQQFVWNNFSEDYTTTCTRHTYYPSVIVNSQSYVLKIMDFPTMPYFPVNSVYDCQGCGVRDANAYMLVLDLSRLETFQYLDTVREQILESRENTVPLLVVGNKIDLFNNEYEECILRRRAIMDRVQLDWGCGYADCSARFNSLVSHVFRLLIEAVDQEVFSSNHACPSVFDHFTYGFASSKCTSLCQAKLNETFMIGYGNICTL